MMEVLRNAGMFLLFVTVYLPLVMAHISGGFKNLKSALTASFKKPGTMAGEFLAAYGEAVD